MRSSVYLMAMLLILHTCNSYILLTANMEDIHALAKQLAASPVVDRVKQIWRRASIQFRKELNTRRRGGETAEEGRKCEIPVGISICNSGCYTQIRNKICSKDGGAIDTERRARRVTRDLVALGKESGYLEPIKQLLEKFQ